MSAWIVDKGHIDVLVSALIEYGLIGPDQARAVGQDLWRENHRSVNARYSERTPTPTYRPRLATEALHPVAVLKASGCYDYQSCEHKGWDSSEAKALTVRLEDAIKARHPDLFVQVVDPRTRTMDGSPHMVPTYYRHPVYDGAPWGFRTVTQAYANAFAESEALS